MTLALRDGGTAGPIARAGVAGRVGGEGHWLGVPTLGWASLSSSLLLVLCLVSLFVLSRFHASFSFFFLAYVFFFFCFIPYFLISFFRHTSVTKKDDYKDIARLW